MKSLLIYGASFWDLIKLVDAVNRQTPTWDIKGFIDDLDEHQGMEYMGYPVLGNKDIISEYNNGNACFFNNVCGHWKNSKLIADILVDKRCKLANLIHPSIDLNYVQLGKSIILPEGCVVGSRTKIGNFVTVRLGTIISHDVNIQDHSFIGPGVTIGSGAQLEMGCFIGAGSTIMLNRKIGKGSLVGAGSIVTKDIPPGQIVAGVPARIIRERP